MQTKPNHKNNAQEVTKRQNKNYGSDENSLLLKWNLHVFLDSFVQSAVK